MWPFKEKKPQKALSVVAIVLGLISLLDKTTAFTLGTLTVSLGGIGLALVIVGFIYYVEAVS